MKKGDLVMLVGTDGFMPPFGAVGEIVSDFDGEDFAVEFPRHPCPNPPGTSWLVPPHMLMYIGPNTRQIIALMDEHFNNEIKRQS